MDPAPTIPHYSQIQSLVASFSILGWAPPSRFSPAPLSIKPTMTFAISSHRLQWFFPPWTTDTSTPQPPLSVPQRRHYSRQTTSSYSTHCCPLKEHLATQSMMIARGDGRSNSLGRLTQCTTEVSITTCSSPA